MVVVVRDNPSGFPDIIRKVFFEKLCGECPHPISREGCKGVVVGRGVLRDGNGKWRVH